MYGKNFGKHDLFMDIDDFNDMLRKIGNCHCHGNNAEEHKCSCHHEDEKNPFKTVEEEHCHNHPAWTNEKKDEYEKKDDIDDCISMDNFMKSFGIDMDEIIKEDFVELKSEILDHIDALRMIVENSTDEKELQRNILKFFFDIILKSI